MKIICKYCKQELEMKAQQMGFEIDIHISPCQCEGALQPDCSDCNIRDDDIDELTGDLGIAQEEINKLKKRNTKLSNKLTNVKTNLRKMLKDK